MIAFIFAATAATTVMPASAEPLAGHSGTFCENMATAVGMKPDVTDNGEQFWKRELATFLQRWVTGGTVASSVSFEPETPGLKDVEGKAVRTCFHAKGGAQCDIAGPGTFTIRTGDAEHSIPALAGVRATVRVEGTKLTCDDLKL
jgi:hypothetical protein